MNRNKVTLLLSFFICCWGILQAQNGKILGVVTDADSGETLPFVNISVNVGEDLKGAQTDFDGNYEIELPEGTHEIKFSFIGYQTQKITQALEAGQTITLNVEMGTESQIMETVVVTGNKFEKKLSEVTVSMEVLKPAALANANDTEISQSIERVPGVDVVDGQANIRGGSGYSYGAGSRVMLLMDGLPVLTSDSGFPNWDFLPVENVSQIEIIKGAASALYGSSAMNGIINLRTAYPTSEPVTKVAAFTGVWQNPSNNDVSVLGEDGNPIQVFNVDSMLVDSTITKSPFVGDYPFETGFSIAHRQKFDRLDFVAGSFLYARNSWRSGQYNRRARFNANLRYRPENIKGLSFGVNTNFMLNTSASYLIWDYQPDPTADSYSPVGQYLLWRALPRINNTGLKITIDPFVEWYNEEGWKFKYLGRYFKNNNQTDTNQSTNSDFIYNEIQGQKRFSDAGLVISAGVVNGYTISNSELFAAGENKTANNIAVYTQIDKEFGETLNISLGARYEINKLDTFDVEAKPVVRAGINYQLGEYTFLRGSFGQAYRFPTIAEAFVRTDLGAVNVSGIPFEIGIFPNPNLRSETGWSAELGVKQGFKISDWSGFVDLTGFINRYQDMMEFTFGVNEGLLPLVQTGIPPIVEPIWPELDTVVISVPDGGAVGFQSINIGNTQILGADISVAGQGKFGKFPARALLGYTYIIPTFREFDEVEQVLSSSDRNILKYRFQHTFKLDMEVEFGKVAFGQSMRYYSFMEAIDEAFNRFLPGVQAFRDEHDSGTFIWDARMRYIFNDQSDVAFIVKNLLNTEYALRPALIDAPRSFTVRYNHNF